MRKFAMPHGKGAPLFASVLLASVLLSGCGGGNGGAKAARRGRLQFTVQWPAAQSRVIPANAQSLVVQIKQGVTVVDAGVIARPASTISFGELPVGALNVTATAYASTDGTGTPLATATVPTTIVANQTANVDVTLASTIDHLSVTPNPFVLGAGFNSQINVVGYDANNAVVLIDPSAISFSSSNSSIVSVNSNGLATAGIGLGSATVTITEADSGKTLSLPVSVVPGITVTPSTPSVTIRGTATFTATVVGPANTSVTWSVQEGAAGGTINAVGLYTAPATKGTYHVVATSVADPSAKTVFAIAVTSGGANVVVH